MTRFALALMMTLAVAACGGSSKPAPVGGGGTNGAGGGGGGNGSATGASNHAAASQPSRAEDTAAVEQVVLAYSAAPGAKRCNYLAQNEITRLGGMAGCQRYYADSKPTLVTVESVDVKGDTASAVTTDGHVSGQGLMVAYQLVREGGSAGVAGGWKISGSHGYYTPHTD